MTNITLQAATLHLELRHVPVPDNASRLVLLNRWIWEAERHAAFNRANGCEPDPTEVKFLAEWKRERNALIHG